MALSSSFFSTRSSSPLPALEKNINFLSLSVSCKKLLNVSGSHVFSTNFKKPRQSFVSKSASSDNGNSSAATPIEFDFPAVPTAFDISGIREILPHRFPMLLVDKLIELTPGVTAVGIKNVTINDNFFPGHFPDRPVMPGLLMVEAMAQVGGLILLHPDAIGPRSYFFLASVEKARFRKPVVPGDTLVMRSNVLKLQNALSMVKMEGKAYVGGALDLIGPLLSKTILPEQKCLSPFGSCVFLFAVNYSRSILACPISLVGLMSPGTPLMWVFGIVRL